MQINYKIFSLVLIKDDNGPIKINLKTLLKNPLKNLILSVLVFL